MGLTLKNISGGRGRIQVYLNQPVVVGLDADAQAVITAIESTGVTLTTTEKNACNQLVVDIKGYGIWTKMKALYGFLGGTAGAHKWNWKDPRDLDVAYRLVFNGGWTHSITGALPNGTNAYADTKLTPSTSGLSLDSTHVSFYSRTDQAAGDFVEIGCGNVDSQFRFIRLQAKDSGANTAATINATISYAQSANSDSKGHYMGIRIISTSQSVWKNGVKLNTANTTSNSLPTIPMYIGAFTQSNVPLLYYSAKECAFASIGDGLTDTEAANLYTAIQAYQTTLSRNV